MREALRSWRPRGSWSASATAGATVRPLSPTEVVDLYGLRIRLESYAAELAAERVTDHELGALVDAADGFTAIVAGPVDDGDAGPGAPPERGQPRVHDRILAAARHDRLATMLARTVDIPLVFQAFRLFGPGGDRARDTFHHLIVDAIGRHERQRAGQLMAEHIRHGMRTVLDGIPPQP